MKQAESIYLDHIGWLDFPEEDEVLQFLREGWFEYSERAFEFAYLREGQSFLDIGAHAGLHATVAAKLVGPRGTVVCVEPNQALLPYLKSNLSRFDHQERIRSCAIAEQSGTRGFAIENSGKSAYSYLIKVDESDQPTPDNVVTSSFYDLCQSEDLQEIDLVKVDIEGAEYEMFSSSEDFLRGKNAVFIVEFSQENLVRAGYDTSMLETSVRKAGLIPCNYDGESNSISPAELVHPIWYNNYILCNDPHRVNKHLSHVENSRLRQVRDIFRKGTAAYELYRQHEIQKTETPKIYASAEKLRDLNSKLTASPPTESAHQAAANSLSSAIIELENVIGATKAISESVADALNRSRESRSTLEAELQERGTRLNEKDALLEEKDALLEEKDALLEEKDALLEEKDALLEEKDALLEEKDALLEEKDALLEEKNTRLQATAQILQNVLQHHAAQLSATVNEIYAIRRSRSYRLLKRFRSKKASAVDRLLETLSR